MCVWHALIKGYLLTYFTYLVPKAEWVELLFLGWFLSLYLLTSTEGHYCCCVYCGRSSTARGLEHRVVKLMRWAVFICPTRHARSHFFRRSWLHWCWQRSSEYLALACIVWYTEAWTHFAFRLTAWWDIQHYVTVPTMQWHWSRRPKAWQRQPYFV